MNYTISIGFDGYARSLAGSGPVTSASAKPRLAGRQPSNRGGVPRVMTRLTAEVAEASAGPVGPRFEEHTVELSPHPMT